MIKMRSSGLGAKVSRIPLDCAARNRKHDPRASFRDQRHIHDGAAARVTFARVCRRIVLTRALTDVGLIANTFFPARSQEAAVRVRGFRKAWYSVCVGCGLGTMEPPTERVTGEWVYDKKRGPHLTPKIKKVYRGMVFAIRGVQKPEHFCMLA